MFTCCHPALEMPARVALTLRALGGLTTGEIARAFLVAEPTMGKRIVRAKRKIADAHIPYLGTSDHLARTIAANGIRLVLDEHRTTETPTLKSGQPGKTKVSYAEPEDALKWLWRFALCRAGGLCRGTVDVGTDGKEQLGIIGRADPEHQRRLCGRTPLQRRGQAEV
jgi:sigma-70-like protein